MYWVPIFNIQDDVISGVLSGINELTGEDKVLKYVTQAKVITDVKYCIECGNEISKVAKFCSACGARQE